MHLSFRLGLAVAGLAISVLVASQVFADFSLSDWRHVKPIVLPTDLGQKSLIELSPDPEVFANSASGLVDLRIIAGDGSEVPYKLDVSKGERERASFPTTIREQGYVPGEYNTFVADLGREGIVHNQIEIHTPATNFRRTATVDASTDGETWARIAEQPVYDFTVKERAFTTSDTTLRYSETTARYLRVRIVDDGGGSLEITGARVLFVRETTAREVPWAASVVSSTRDTEKRTSVVDVDLGVEGLPSHRLAVRVPDVNFYREVRLEISSNREEWSRATQAAIFSYDTPKFVGNGLVLNYPETTTRYLRLTIFDEDNSPLDLQGVDVRGLRRIVFFLATPGQSYELYYGNLEARRPVYDIERLLPYLATEDLPQASLGPHDDNPQFVEAAPPSRPVSERLPWLLPVVVAVAAVAVGLILFGVLRNARKVLPPPAE